MTERLKCFARASFLASEGKASISSRVSRASFLPKARTFGRSASSRKYRSTAYGSRLKCVLSCSTTARRHRRSHEPWSGREALTVDNCRNSQSVRRSHARAFVSTARAKRSHGDFTEKSRYGASVSRSAVFVSSDFRPAFPSGNPTRASASAAPTGGSRWASSAPARGSSTSSTPQPSVASFGVSRASGDSMKPRESTPSSSALDPASTEGAPFRASGDRPRATGGSSSDEQSSSHPSSDSSAPESPMARPPSGSSPTPDGRARRNAT